MKDIHSLKTNIKKMFNKYGLEMVSNSNPHKVPNLPNEYDIPLFRLSIEQHREKGAMDFILSSNHFRVIDLEFFFPNFIDNLSFEDRPVLEEILNAVRIFYKNNKLTLNYHNLNSKSILILSQNKSFMEHFARGFQVKALFSNEPKKRNDIQEKLAYFILDKIVDLGFKEKIFIDLPKLVVNELICE